LTSTRTEFYYSLALAYEKAGDLDKAAETYETILAFTSSRRWSFDRLGRSYSG
jgi:tetratricopeptide (TPR) repeat protein